MPIPFVKDFDPSYGCAVTLRPDIRRLTVQNPSAYTFTGTNTYIIGADTLAIIDPGPIDEDHLQNLLRIIGRHKLSHIFITHCHHDHSPLAKLLAKKTGALIIAEGAYRPAFQTEFDKAITNNGSAEIDFVPDYSMRDGEIIEGDGWAIGCVTTPGHMANHAAFALEGTGILFSGDHVMAWATTVIAPPDGSMKDYMASLDKLLTRNDQVYLPGHGGAVYKPHNFVRALKTHRKMRERAIFECIQQGNHFIKDIVQQIYQSTDQKLHGAAALSVLAHIKDLVDLKLIKCAKPLSLDTYYSAS